MNGIEKRLTSTMKARDVHAPTAEELAAVSRQTSPTKDRHRGRLAAVAVATAVVVAGAGLGAWALRHRAAPITKQPAATILVFIVEDQPAPLPRRSSLVPVTLTGSPSARTALDALFAYHPSAGRSNPWVGVGLTSVVHRNGIWHIDVSRAPRWAADAEVVMQSLAWTLSTATESPDPIAVDVAGKRVRTRTGSPVSVGVPVFGYLATSGREVPWAQRTCSARSYVVVAAGVRFDVRSEVGGYRRGPAPTAQMHVGDTIRVLPDGLCFRHVAVSVTRAPHRGFGGTGSTSWTAPSAGRFILQIGGAMCPPSDFTTNTAVTCLGGFHVYGWLHVLVIRG